MSSTPSQTNTAHPKRSHQAKSGSASGEGKAAVVNRVVGSRFRLLYNLNAQMQVWVEMRGGGPNQPLRMVVYCDLALLNQTTLKLSYFSDDKRRCLHPVVGHAARGWGGGGWGRSRPADDEQEADMRLRRGRSVSEDEATEIANAAAADEAPAAGGGLGAAEEGEIRPESLYLLCRRGGDGKVVPKLRLRVDGVLGHMTRNHQIENGELEAGARRRGARRAARASRRRRRAVSACTSLTSASW